MKIYYLYAPIRCLFVDRQSTRTEVYAITDDKKMKNQFLEERAEFFECRVDEVEKSDWKDMLKLTPTREKLLVYEEVITFDHSSDDSPENRMHKVKILCTNAEKNTLETSLETVFATTQFNSCMEIPAPVFQKSIQKNLCKLQLPSIIRAKHSNDDIGLSIQDFELTQTQIDTANMDDWSVIQPEVSVDELMLFLTMYAHLFK